MKIFLLSITILILILSFYLITRIHKLPFINKIQNTFVSWLIPIIIILIAIILSFIYKITILVIMIHLTFFLLLGDLIYKLTKSRISYTYIMVISIILTSGYIIYAWNNAYDIKETKYIINSNKIDNSINIVQISDTHIGTTYNGKEFKKYLTEISKINPDVLVITGDFVDENTTYSDLIDATISLSETKTKYGIYIIFGNHDINRNNDNRSYTNNELKETLKTYNIKLLEDETILINNSFYLIGRRDKTDKERKDLNSFITDIDKSKILITLDHQPINEEENVKNNIDLVLSGHTHDGQLIPLKYGITLFNNQMTYGEKKINNTTFIVSSGMSGWGTPLKTGTKNEYVNILIKKSS